MTINPYIFILNGDRISPSENAYKTALSPYMALHFQYQKYCNHQNLPKANNHRPDIEFLHTCFSNSSKQYLDEKKFFMLLVVCETFDAKAMLCKYVKIVVFETRHEGDTSLKERCCVDLFFATSGKDG